MISYSPTRISPFLPFTAGDTLFLMGCGRVFEGTMEQMFSSVSKIKVRRLPYLLIRLP